MFLRWAFEGWVDAWWRRFTQHDLKGDLQIGCRLANSNLRDEIAALFERRPKRHRILKSNRTETEENG